jgi:hypothetical protein
MNRSFSLSVLIAIGLAIAGFYNRGKITDLAPAPGALPLPWSGEIRSIGGEHTSVSAWQDQGDFQIQAYEGANYLIKLTEPGTQPVAEAAPGLTPEAEKPPGTPHPAVASRAQAMRGFPALAQPGSVFNQRFAADYQALQTRHSSFLAQPDWPMKLAGQVAYELNTFTVFMRGGYNVRINVPYGVYTLKIASGNHWYGYQDLFGPGTTYTKIDLPIFFNPVTLETLTLQKAGAGNLLAKPISGQEF